MAVENFIISDMCDDGICLDFLYYLEADTSREEMVGRRNSEKKEGIMQALDPTIAYYLCGIMVVLALIIGIGASWQRSKDK